MRNINKRRCAFWFGGIFAALFVGIAIAGFVKGNAEAGTGCLVFGFVGFTFISCLFLGNNFIGDMVAEIFSWGFVRMPGLIFTLDLDGIIWLLTVKLAFWILGILLALLFGILGVLLGAALSIFVYPYAIIKNLNSNPEEVE
ncbi:MAG: hypothetical protein J6T24_03140 [Clostridia bacterium]|nr:hypothetical protein [Clostridia bacterium]